MRNVAFFQPSGVRIGGKAAKSGRAARAPQEGKVAPLATACAPRPFYVMPPLAALQKCRLTQEPPSPNPAQRRRSAPNEEAHKRKAARATGPAAQVARTRRGMSC